MLKFLGKLTDYFELYSVEKYKDSFNFIPVVFVPLVNGQSDTRGCEHCELIASFIFSVSSMSSPRIVAPAWRDAHVANVHQLLHSPVRSATAADSCA